MYQIDWSHSYSHRLSSSCAFIHDISLSTRLATRLNTELEQGALPFLSLEFLDPLVSSLPDFVNDFSHCTDILLLGIGGSSLGTKFLYDSFADKKEKRLWFADNIHPEEFFSWLSSFSAKKLLVLVVSKSGGTIETISQYFFAKEYLQKELGKEWTKHLVFVTDPERGLLREQSNALGISSISIPPALGGRYSVFSAVGLLPAALLGIDYMSMVQQLRSDTCSADFTGESLLQHPSFQFALWASKAMSCNYSECIFFSYIPSWSLLGAWFAQLWAESLGKSGKGSMPVPALGVCDQHSVNQMFLAGPRNKSCLFLEAKHFDKGPIFPSELAPSFSFLQGKRYGDLLVAEALGTRLALQQSEVPLSHALVDDTSPASAASFMQFLMFSTLLCGWMLDINPLDQEAVELGKRLAYAKLGADGYVEEKALLEKQ